MSAALIVASILVLGWNLTLITIALVTGTGPFQNREPNRTMSRARKHVRAEIGKPELDARTTAWKREMGVGTTESIQSRLMETQQEVTVPASYAEASVTVGGEDGDEVRRCSVCMN